MRLAYTICMGMFGSGVKIGLETTRQEWLLIQKGQQWEFLVWGVAGLSVMMYRMFVLPFGPTRRRPSEPFTFLVSAWRRHHNYCLVTLFLAASIF